jgi:putative FmdB family regulatory protein
MPTYEYVCKTCGHLFEVVQSMKDDPLTECPECGGELRKVFAPPAISFKGSGFYATDHGKEGRSAPSEHGGDKKKESGSGSGDAKPSDTKKGDGGGSSSSSGSGSSGSGSSGSGSSGSESSTISDAKPAAKKEDRS